MESAALAALANALAEQRISAAQFAQCRDALEAVRAATQSAQQTIDELKSGNREVELKIQQESIELERNRLRKEEVERSVLAAEVEHQNASNAARDFTARHTSIQTEINEAKQREVDLQSDVAQLKLDNQNMVIPALQAVAQDLSDTRAEIGRCDSTVEALREQKADLKSKIEGVRAAGSKSLGIAHRLKQELARAQSELPRLHRALDIVKDALAEAQKDKEKLSSAVAQRDKELAGQLATLHEVQAIRKGLERKLASHRLEVGHAEEETGDVDRTVRAEKQQNKDLLERKMEMAAEEDSTRHSARAAVAHAEAVSALYERAIRELKRVQERLAEAQLALAPLQGQLKDKELEIRAVSDEISRLGKEEASVRRAMDSVVAKYLKEEALEKKAREGLAELVADCASLDAEKEQWEREDDLAKKQLHALSVSTSLKGKELAKTNAARRAVVEGSRVKELALLDLTKQLAELQARMATSTGLYESVKAERNSLQAAISRAKQSIAEMHERLKILTNEADILDGEAEGKEKALTKERAAAAATSTARDVLRAEVNKAIAMYRAKQHAVESRILAIDKLSGVIASLERDMLQAKRAYEGAVEMRNYTGIQLIDRNDELCVLYEKGNGQARTLEQGEVALRAVGEECRGLALVVADLQRSLHVALARAPESSKWAERALNLQRDVSQARVATEKLSALLETPHAPGSEGKVWQQLEGVDEPMEELQRKETSLQARLDSARESLLQRDMALEELTALLAKLRGEVGLAGGGQGAVDVSDSQAVLAKQANDLQGKLRDATRRLMALVSELTVYQSSSLRLEADIAAAGEALDKARDALAEGQAPSAQAERDLLTSTRRAQLVAQRTAVEEEGRTHGVAGSGPAPRPTGYLPSGVATPQPYGQFAPFKPQETTAAGRYYKAQPSLA